MNKHGFEVGDRVRYKNKGVHLLDKIGTVIESTHETMKFAVRFDDAELNNAYSMGSDHIRKWFDGAFFEPVPVTVGCWVRVAGYGYGHDGKKFYVDQIVNGEFSGICEDKRHYFDAKHLRVIEAPTTTVTAPVQIVPEVFQINNDLRHNTATGKLERLSVGSRGTQRWDVVPDYTPYPFKVGDVIVSSTHTMTGEVLGPDGPNHMTIKWGNGIEIRWSVESLRTLCRLAPERPALKQAQELACMLHEKHYAASSPEWKVADDLSTVLHQIDNMTVGMMAAHEINDAQRHRENMSEQIERLAQFIIHKVPGEPSRGDEGAIDCAIRVMNKQRKVIESVKSVVQA